MIFFSFIHQLRFEHVSALLVKIKQGWDRHDCKEDPLWVKAEPTNVSWRSEVGGVGLEKGLVFLNEHL